MIQLSLFPRRGFALLALGELLIDRRLDMPAVYSTRRTAEAVRKRAPHWIGAYAEVVPVEVHDEETFLIL